MIEAEQPDVACPICAKHRGEGPLAGPKVFEDEHVVVSHRPVGEDATAFLGYLFVESRRHVPFLDGLTDTEASAIGLAVRGSPVDCGSNSTPSSCTRQSWAGVWPISISMCSSTTRVRRPSTAGWPLTSGPTLHVAVVPTSSPCAHACARTWIRAADTRTGSLGRKRVRCRWRAMWARDVSLVP